ncbi:hypothetical protein RRG08_050519 [Elysia crispata]|uniref:Uncharacterized protein n=1 Tax=Elysia crispata TaxID=231223 RepID=A0AAE0XTM0_9GAST|nr:hypothetical protein RRG08_050519 [Elysia crispata]
MATFIRFLQPSKLCKLCGINTSRHGSVGGAKRIPTRASENSRGFVSQSLKAKRVECNNALGQLHDHNGKPAGQRFASGQATHVKKGLSRTSRALLAVSGVLSAGYLAVRLTVTLDEPAKPYQLGNGRLVKLFIERKPTCSASRNQALPSVFSECDVKPRTMPTYLLAANNKFLMVTGPQRVFFPPAYNFLDSTFPRLYLSSTPPFLDSTFPRLHLSSTPPFLDSTFPRLHLSSTPPFLDSTFPRLHLSSTLPFLDSTFPRLYLSSTPPFLDSTFPPALRGSCTVATVSCW